MKSPLNQQEARANFAFAPAGELNETKPPTRAIQAAPLSQDLLSSLITNKNLSLPLILAAVMVALGLGALHAVSPGHGKTIMAAYLVGTRGTATHALFLGLTVTISHTLGVLGLGILVLYGSDLVAPEHLYPWLSLLSGAVIMAIGAWLLARRIRGNIGAHPSSERLIVLGSHTHSHAHHDGAVRRSGRRQFMWQVRDLGSKLAHGHSHDHSSGHLHAVPSSQSNNGLRVTWKSLASLGIVGGLVPSASALVILLAAVSMHRVEFGLLLIVAFSAGMAIVLGGIGLTLVYARRTIERFQSRNRLVRGLTQALPTTTALVVLVSGIVLVTRAVSQMGTA